MTKTEIGLGVGVLIAIVIAVGGYNYPEFRSAVQNIAGVTNYDEVDATAMKIGGTNGTRVGPFIPTTCSLIDNGSVTGSTTKQMDCAVTGVVSGDYVLAQLATSTTIGTGQAYWNIVAAKASTTAGFVTVLLYNNGPAATPSVTGVGSSTNIWVAHPLTSVPGL